MKRGKKVILSLLILAFYVLHQDFWNWKKVGPLLFGMLPIGLAYHAAYSVAAACLMAILVKVAWPSDLEKAREAQTKPGAKGAD